MRWPTCKNIINVVQIPYTFALRYLDWVHFQVDGKFNKQIYGMILFAVKD